MSSSNTRRPAASGAGAGGGHRYLREDASQMEVHHFDANDDDDEDEDDEDEDEGDEDNSNDEDPYNARLQQHQHQQHHEQQFLYPQGYDSMSTILEVDSEASRASSASPASESAASERPRDVGSPLEVQTTATTMTATSDGQQQRRRRQSAGSPVGTLSPEDKFGGTLSALAAQVERLQRRAAAAAAAAPTSTLRPISQDQPQQSAVVSPGRQNTADTSGRPAREEEGATQETDHQQLTATASASKLPPKSRTNSAESLMMINLSPLGSPKLRFSPTVQFLGRLPSGETDAAAAAGEQPAESIKQIVEVTNKSTNTIIDLSLMDEMARRYFVEHCDKSTQSIKFDCDDAELTTIDMSSGSPRRGLRSAGGPTGPPRPQTKSVAVGTEKFARERFSLLPQTKTRATQTKANLSDSDLGTSETRRFKLSHLSDLGPLIGGKKSATIKELAPKRLDDSLNGGGDDDEAEERGIEDAKENKPAQQVEDDETRGDASGATKPSEGQKRAKLVKAGKPDEDLREQQVAARSESRAGLAATSPARDLDGAESSSPSSSASASASVTPSSSSSSAALSPVASETKSRKQLAQARPKPKPKPRPEPEPEPTAATPKEDTSAMKQQPSQQQQQIPSLKTELRVIIEFADSKQKQRSEMLSNSSLTREGILSKRTELVTSRHLAASPRQVLDRLESAGQRHSLMYQQQQQQPTPLSTPTPRSSRAGGSSLVSATAAAASPASAVASQREAIQRQTQDNGQEQQPHWHEVSKSTVRNEIETDTRTGRRGRGGQQSQAAGAEAEAEDIILSSQAVIRRLADNKNAVKLHSRASKRYPTTGKDGQQQHHHHHHQQRAERLLVESVAGFDESQEAEGDIADRHPQLSATPAAMIAPKDRPVMGPPGASHQVASSPTLPSGANGTSSRWEASRVTGQSPVETNASRQQQQKILAHQQSDRPRPSRVPPVVRQQQTPASPAHGGGGQPTPPPPPPLAQSATATNGLHHNLRGQSNQSDTRETSRTSTPQQAAPTTTTRKKIEFAEEKEDRRQVTRNGRLVYDDRLREHRFESFQSPPPPSTSADRLAGRLGGGGGGGSPQSMAATGRGYPPSARTSQQQQYPVTTNASSLANQLLRPARLVESQRQSAARTPPPTRPIHMAGPPALFADQTAESNLSSDLETMDSGFVQSTGAGSSSNIHHHHHHHQVKPGGQFEAAPQRRPLPQSPMSPIGGQPMSSRLSSSPVQVAANGGGGRTTRPRDRQQPQSSRASQLMGAGPLGDVDVGGGIAFVDDIDEDEDEDDFVEQLGGGGGGGGGRGPRRLDRTRARVNDDATASTRSQLNLLPPVEFQNDHHRGPAQQGGPETSHRQPAMRRCESMPKLTSELAPIIAPRNDPLLQDSELTTRLTRRKFKRDNSGSNLRRRTLTKLEQSLVAPDLLGTNGGGPPPPSDLTPRPLQERSPARPPAGRPAIGDGAGGSSNRSCHHHHHRHHQFRAQVMFESDTDSTATDRQSVNSSRSGPNRGTTRATQSGSTKRKELLTETKYSLTRGGTTAGERDVSRQTPGKPSATGHAQRGSARFAAGGPEPNWDYSLKVNRMRGDKLDSRVDTYIKHTRLPLIINSKAA